MEGRVQICDGYYRWGTVCNRQWTSSHTKVVCRSLGYDDTEGKTYLLANATLVNDTCIEGISLNILKPCSPQL